MRRSLVLVVAMLLTAGASCAGTVEDVQARGVVTCAVPADSPGIAVKSGSGVAGTGRTGLAIDFCTMLAAAVLGRTEATAFVEVSADDGAVALQAGEADVLLSPQPWTLEQEVESGMMLVRPLLGRAADGAVFGPVVRQGDDAWFVALRWILLALEARSVPPEAEAKAAAGLGLHPQWLTNIRAVSKDYAALLERHMKDVAAAGWAAVQPGPAPAW